MMPDPIQGVSLVEASGVTSTAQPESPQPSTTTEQQSSNTSVDSADVARAEALLATITQAAAAVPPINSARVAELKQEINSGIYEANPQKIAAKMIEIEALLASKGKDGQTSDV
jgi:flagellar biosynthesis anti-sigma factor FlgM